jgi:hypothetical protein
MVPAFDPVITLFKAGYLLPPPSLGAARLLYNRTPGHVDEVTRLRPYGNDGGTVAMEPFRGTVAEWLQQLSDLAYPPTGGGAVIPSQRELFGAAYRNRLLRVRAELERLSGQAGTKALLGVIDRSLGRE